MSAKKRHDDERPNQPDEARTPEQPERSPRADQADQAREAEPAETDSSADFTGALRQERDDLEQRLLRTAADFQNYVKRAEQNIETARQQQLIDMAKSLTAVLDHFDRALAVDPDQTTTQDVLAGVQMVRQELLNVLERFGITRIEVRPGEPFDPNRHEALMREKRDDVETNHVTQQLQPGYVIDNKLIRAAKVGVAE